MKKPTDIIEPMEIEKEKGRVLRKRKEKIPKIYKREANEKEISSFRKRVLRIPREKPFEEAYFTHRLWMFFRETKETEEDIRRMFNEVRDSLKKRITLEKKGDPGKFTIPCSVKGIEFPRALCDTGSGVSILPKIMADHLGLKIEPTEETFIFVDCSQQNSGGIVLNLEVQIDDAVIPTDFHVLDVKLNFKTSLLLGRAFLATVGAVCDLKTNKLCLTLINPTTHYDPIQVTKLPRKETPALVATCFYSQEYDSMAEYETEPYVSTDEGNPTSTDTEQPERTDAEIMASIDKLFTEADKEFPDGDFKIDIWHNDHYIPILATDTTEEEYDEDYEEERAT